MNYAPDGTLFWLAGKRNIIRCFVEGITNSSTAEYSWKTDGLNINVYVSSKDQSGSFLLFKANVSSLDSATFTCEVTLFGEIKDKKITVKIIGN